ncbi:hypothetical protein PPYR_01979 [Photinus pyralis]|uniref:DDE Tnp4 domain-containing protein n=1 Tax=Photinus pyralis TaxID=7054 RepID=A0A1Y1KRG9_PHOPY|nr:hypothetical protein PPYR_01979 [Photinus pyralis]
MATEISSVIKEEYHPLEAKEEVVQVDDDVERVCIKTEQENCDDFLETPEEDTRRLTEEYLRRNPTVVCEMCGLSDINVFNTLLTYIESEIPVLKGATGYEQLISVLAKLYTDDDTAILNSYLFPSVYVTGVELLYDKLDMLCRNSSLTLPLPSVFMPEFDSTQRVIIIGFLLVSIRSTFEEFPENLHTVKYLIAYSPFGEVIFVSIAFVGSVSNFSLILLSGILQKLGTEDWILFNERNFIYVSQVKEISMKNKKKLRQLNSGSIAEHMSKVVRRVKQFKVLHSFIPDFMLKHQAGVCFLDKLVFVCCMILNLFPRIVYY